MLFYTFNLISSFSIIIPFIMVLFLKKWESKTFLPFSILLGIGLLSEVLGWYCTFAYKNNLIIGNIYVLIESIVLLVQFSIWNDKKKNSVKFIILGLLFFTIWLVDNFLLQKTITVNSLFRVFYSIVIVFLSIEQINFVFFTERNNVLLNARFVFCVAFVIYFTYKSVFEVFYMIDVRMSNNFYYALFNILVSVNLFTNLLFAFAVLCIPKKQKFTLPF